jgi:hypothetical protein
MKTQFALLLLFSVLAFSNCKSPQSSTETLVTKISNPTTSKNPKLVNPTALASFLPAEVLGLKRTELEGEKTEISNKDVIAASAEYRGTDRMLRITITDGSSSALGISGLAPWMKGDINNKSEHGYERTAEIEGYKGYESYDRVEQSGQVSVLVANRFIVSVDGERVAEGEPSQALKTIDLKKLASLK